MVIIVMNWRREDAYGTEVVVDVEFVQVGEMTVETESHQESCMLIGQFSRLRLVEHNPGWVNLTRSKN